MPTRVASLLLTSLITLTAACASSGGGAASASSSCELQPRDSVYAAFAPVYRECAVTTKARLLTTDVHPDFSPPRGSTCFSVEVEFVVTRTGTVDASSVRVLKSNSQQFTDALLTMLARVKYEPATRDGVPVSQITGLKQTAQLMTVVVPAGTSPSRVNPGRARPSC